MAEPRVPGADDLELPCGETISVTDLHLGMRDYPCACGDDHAVVLDPHPLSRFFPESMVAVLDETVETTDGGSFGTSHLMALVLEDFPDQVAAKDTAKNGEVGYGMAWVAAFDSRRLHEIVVELVVELMDHAIGHSEDDDAIAEFDEQLAAFDVSAFVDEYRSRREFRGEDDTPV